MGSQNSKVDYSIRAPYGEDDTRFVRSFLLSDDANDILKFYEEYGFVVFDNILDDREIARSIDDLWSTYPGASVDDPETWHIVNHPFSFVGERPIDGLQMWDNRQHPRVYEAFKLLYSLTSKRDTNNEPLVACLDRGSIMLPTAGQHGKEEWLTQPIPHFDLNPFVWHGLNPASQNDLYASYTNYRLLLSEGNNTAHRQICPKLRAVLQLSESTATTGGFQCSAGFHRSLRAWCGLQKNVRRGEALNAFGWGVPLGDPIEDNMQKITMRAGSMVVFSAELPHTMYGNESAGFRYAQYLRMQPLSTLEMSDEQAEKRRRMIQDHIPSDLIVTKIGQEVFQLLTVSSGADRI